MLCVARLIRLPAVVGEPARSPRALACATMAELALKLNRARGSIRGRGLYRFYKRLLKEHAYNWHDVTKLLSALAELIFDVDNVSCGKTRSKVSLQFTVGIAVLDLVV